MIVLTGASMVRINGTNLVAMPSDRYRELMAIARRVAEYLCDGQGRLWEIPAALRQRMKTGRRADRDSARAEAVDMTCISRGAKRWCVACRASALVKAAR